ncbi:hypothetical protein MBLNU459_g4397t1 [Dothideomycetes sp. NU459]
MNNQQFRKLVLDTPARQDGASSSPKPGATPSTLGSKRSSFIPMTPRTVRGATGSDFARQVAERNAASQPTKKFRSSGPKGSKLAAGFQDRTLERRDLESDEKAARIQALEEQMKLGQLDPSTFERLRDQITGGELASTHLVKGLDRQLLERIRKGEDVLGSGDTQSAAEIDEALEELEEKEIAPVEREQVVKKGEMAPPPPVAGNKRSRDAILAELKAQRKAAAEARLAARPELGSQFRDISAKPRAGAPRIELDEKGREVRIVVDEHGNTKKKVRKVQVAEPNVPAQSYKFLDEGITIPAPKPKNPEPVEEEEEEEDIFADVGTAYNPLGDEQDDDSDVSSDEEGLVPSKAPPIEKQKTDASDIPAASESSSSLRTGQAEDAMPPPLVPPPPSTAASRNYFKSSSSTAAVDEATPQNPFNDAAFLAAIKKAGALSNISLSLGASKEADGEEDDEAKEARLRKRAAMLAATDRDLDDMDLGFGSSRYGDAEDGEEGGSKVKLSEWKGTAGDDEEDDGDERGGGGRRKRVRKRKGDKDSAKDVLGVLERRKEHAK